MRPTEAHDEAAPLAERPGAFARREAHVPTLTLAFKEIGEGTIEADIFLPPEPRPAPVILWIHGGALIWGSRHDIMDDQLDAYLRAGYAIVSVDYRLAPESRFADIMADVRDAYRWVVRDLPQVLPIDEQCRYVVGHSAGAYLALLLGLEVPRPTAIASFYGYGTLSWAEQASPYYASLPAVTRAQALAMVGDRPVTHAPHPSDRQRFYEYCRQQVCWLDEVVGAHAGNVPTELQPALQLDREYPPTLLLHGKQDEDVPFDESTRLRTRLQEQGVRSRLIAIDDVGHVFGFAGMEDPQVSDAIGGVLGFFGEALHP